METHAIRCQFNLFLVLRYEINFDKCMRVSTCFWTFPSWAFKAVQEKEATRFALSPQFLNTTFPSFQPVHSSNYIFRTRKLWTFSFLIRILSKSCERFFLKSLALGTVPISVVSFAPEKLPFWLSDYALFKIKIGSSDNRVLDWVCETRQNGGRRSWGVNRRDFTRQTDTFGKVYKCVSSSADSGIRFFSFPASFELSAVAVGLLWG